MIQRPSTIDSDFCASDCGSSGTKQEDDCMSHILWTDVSTDWRLRQGRIGLAWPKADTVDSDACLHIVHGSCSGDPHNAMRRSTIAGMSSFPCHTLSCCQVHYAGNDVRLLLQYLSKLCSKSQPDLSRHQLAMVSTFTDESHSPFSAMPLQAV